MLIKDRKKADAFRVRRESWQGLYCYKHVLHLRDDDTKLLGAYLSQAFFRLFLHLRV